MKELDEFQKTILRVHASGGRVKDAASVLGASNWRIQHGIRAIYRKLTVSSIPQAIAKLSGFKI